MTKTGKNFLHGCLILSCTAFVLVITSFATDHWLEANLFTSNLENYDSIYYGLFKGQLEKRIGLSNTYKVYMTCLLEDNICAVSCLDTENDRKEEIKQLYENGIYNFACTSIHSKKEEISNHTSGTKSSSPKGLDLNFINGGVWVSVISILSLSLLLAGLTFVITALNVFSNPIQLIFSILGLYIWNGLAILTEILVILIWGSEFAITLNENVGYIEVISGNYFPKSSTELGYSYWLILGSIFLHILSVLLLQSRRYYIMKILTPPIVLKEPEKDGEFLY